MEVDTELEKWLKLVHGGNPCLRDLNRFIQARMPGHTLPELAPDALADCLDRVLATLPSPDAGAVTADIRWLEGHDGRYLLPITDSRYPWLLRQIPDPPLALYASGDPACLNRPCLAIVGSRNPTPQGRETATGFGRRFAEMGFTVVSGLARGIDGCAHRGALESGTTVGVCAHGLDTVYPDAHRALAAAMSGTSALISEFPTGIGPKPHQFPQRNRLISGLSLGTLVVEAGLKSGSLITANLAGEQNREVFSVPGPINAPSPGAATICSEKVRPSLKPWTTSSMKSVTTETAGHIGVIYPPPNPILPMPGSSNTWDTPPAPGTSSSNAAD